MQFTLSKSQRKKGLIRLLMRIIHPKKGNHKLEEKQDALCAAHAERFFTLTSHYCSGKRLILKPLNFGGRWQNCQFPHGGKSQLASPHLLSAGRKSYYFVYIKI